VAATPDRAMAPVRRRAGSRGSDLISAGPVRSSAPGVPGAERSPVLPRRVSSSDPDDSAPPVVVVVLPGAVPPAPAVVVVGEPPGRVVVGEEPGAVVGDPVGFVGTVVAGGGSVVEGVVVGGAVVAGGSVVGGSVVCDSITGGTVVVGSGWAGARNHITGRAPLLADAAASACGSPSMPRPRTASPRASQAAP
jgi:hypothetical protein